MRQIATGLSAARHLRHSTTARALTALAPVSPVRLAFGGAICAAAIAHAFSAFIRVAG